MTKEEKEFTERQLHLIQEKIDEDALIKYGMLLSVADMTDEVKTYLNKAVDTRIEELNPLCPLAVNGDMDDFN